MCRHRTPNNPRRHPADGRRQPTHHPGLSRLRRRTRPPGPSKKQHQSTATTSTPHKAGRKSKPQTTELGPNHARSRPRTHQATGAEKQARAGASQPTGHVPKGTHVHKRTVDVTTSVCKAAQASDGSQPGLKLLHRRQHRTRQATGKLNHQGLKVRHCYKRHGLQAASQTGRGATRWQDASLGGLLGAQPAMSSESQRELSRQQDCRGVETQSCACQTTWAETAWSWGEGCMELRMRLTQQRTEPLAYLLPPVVLPQ